MLNLCTLTTTRFTHTQTLLDLGIREDYYALMKSMGFGNLPMMESHLCIRYAKEFLPTVHLHFVDPLRTNVDKGSISLIIEGKLHTMSLFQLCDIFWFSHHNGTEMFVKSPASKFWKLIAYGSYISRDAKQSLKRNIVVHVTAKFISNTFVPRLSLL